MARAFAGGAEYLKKIAWEGGGCGREHGRAVTFVVAAVLICEEGIESPSYHLGDEGRG